MFTSYSMRGARSRATAVDFGHQAKADEAVSSAPRTAGTSDGLVRLAYQYTDGRHVVTEVMLRAEAVAYMPLLGAVQVRPDLFQAQVATIEFRAVA